jgi:hypothetical protein
MFYWVAKIWTISIRGTKKRKKIYDFTFFEETEKNGAIYTFFEISSLLI